MCVCVCVRACVRALHVYMHAILTVIIIVLLLLLLFIDLYESSSSGSQLSIKCSKIHPPLLISLTPAEKKLARLFQKQLGLLGNNMISSEML